ncbi:MAG: ATP-binding protein [Raineya sp.]|jgi:Na+/proline symporter/nitrogen-specific signal transduction histidine kinase|nr:ATP-binding protein [Raineya sp.]
MNWGIIIIASLLYLGLLFILAYVADKKAQNHQSLINSPYVYALSLAVYCTAWTYYGSVGRASKSGIDFLLIYLGPTLSAPLWWFIIRKIIRISKIQNISNIADLIATRYGKSAILGAIVTIVSVLGIVPYISLQIKAIGESFSIMIATQEAPIVKPVYIDYAFYTTIVLAIFTLYFGTRQLDLNKKNEGMVFAIAFESLFKLWAFLVVGGYITFFVFDGFEDIFSKAFAQKELQHLFTINTQSGYKALEWFLIGLASMLAIMFLPRQFQMLVAENKQEKHLQKAIWLFPLYLLVINIFVMPIALAGKLSFPDSNIDADTYILALPLANNQNLIALITYLGGFAAATSMVIVASLALSLMLTNNLFIPISLYFSVTKHLKGRQWGRWVLYTRRLSVVLILTLAYGYLTVIADAPLVSIGLISFVAVSQFAPAIIGGLYWKDATQKGAMAGILIGFVMWAFTLVLPTLINKGIFPESIISEGLWGMGWLKPYQLFGLKELEPVAHSLFWSLLFNIAAYTFVSIQSNQTSQERSQAEFFVDVFKYSNIYEEAVVWRGIAHKKDLEELLSGFLGAEKVKNLLADFEKEQNIASQSNQENNAKLVKYAERILASTIGSTSARILVASVVQEDEISKEELLQMLRESQELKKLNFELKKTDKQKNEFIGTVTHELRTPITSIRSFSEILYDNPDLDENQRQQFLQTVINETQRMERLINQVLDLEKFDSGKQVLNLEKIDIQTVIKEAIEIYQTVIQEKNLHLDIHITQQNIFILADKDRILQIILNFLSNAVKFSKKNIIIDSRIEQDNVKVVVADDGKGVPEELKDAIFEKFFQAENQTIKKPKGSGLGLAICKKIIQYHKGQIGVETSNGLTRFYFTLPIIH